MLVNNNGFGALELPYGRTMEFNWGVVHGVFEYKRFTAKICPITLAQWSPFLNLCEDRYDAAGKHRPLLACIVRYWPDPWTFQAIPLNETASERFSQDELITEIDFCRKILFEMHGRRLSDLRRDSYAKLVKLDDKIHPLASLTIPWMEKESLKR